DVTAALEQFDTQRAGSLLAAYIDDLSNWYVRRSRRRFWTGDAAALATLHECLYVVTLLMAPITPFVTERVWQDVFRNSADESPMSVHLARWPVADEILVDDDLDASVRLSRRLVELGRSARAEAKVRTRQPLQRALVGSATFELLNDELLAEVAGELNVQRVESFGSAGDLVEHTVKANFRTLGKRFGKQTPAVAAAIAAADPAKVARDLALSGATTLWCEGDDIQLTADDVIVSEHPARGWSVVNEHGETIALDLELTPALLRAGVAREVIRLVQEARKARGFDVSDRITLTWWTPDSDTRGAILEHADLIAGEVLAVRLEEAVATSEPTHSSGFWSRDGELALSFQVELACP
ncbi:MAG: class I tRNA ligase family protein, partial [Nocardioidaceae bacterium]|nr:class I tRNA ligase family protein [Nocardioidaceae bacterium]